MADLYVSWSDYHRAIERLAAQVHASAWSFDQIVCIARGGLRVGDVMSRIFRRPLAIIFTQSYIENAGRVQGEITVSKHMAMMTPDLGMRVLLVDDLVDSGVTLEVVKELLVKEHPNVREMRTAVLWYKASSKLVPDYYVEHLAENPWIHQPFEPYDVMRPEDLARRSGPA
jgi:hypothetical protein